MLAGFENVVPTDDRLQLIDDDGLIHSQEGGSGTVRPPSEIAPLQLEGHPEAERSKKKSQQEGLKAIIIGSICFSISVTVALILTIYLAPPAVPLHGGVVSDSLQCSELGTGLLRRGGSAVDAAIGTILCVGLVNPLHSGIGGGGVMLIRNQKRNTSTVIDFMDTAPAGSTGDISDSQPGSLVAVPGMLRGLGMAHSKYGKLSWKDVIMSVVNFAAEGVNVSSELSKEIEDLKKDPKAQELSDYFSRAITGSVMKINEILGLLRNVANKGVDAYYKGTVAQEIVDTVNGGGGKMTVDDLMEYTAKSPTPIQTTFLDMNVETVPAPAGGPVLLLLLNVFENVTKERGISFNSSDIFHYVVESMKFAFAHQSMVGDPAYMNINETKELEDMISKSFAGELASRLDDNATNLNSAYYSHDEHVNTRSSGTSHVSVIGPEDDIVSVTASLNGEYGSGLVTSTSHIILNSNMVGFDQSKVNVVQPRKRPVVSLSPIIIFNPVRSCGLRMTLGATHGNSAISGLAQVIFNILGLQEALDQAIDAPRVYDPLLPEDLVVYDKCGDYATWKGTPEPNGRCFSRCRARSWRGESDRVRSCRPS